MDGKIIISVMGLVYNGFVCVSVKQHVITLLSAMADWKSVHMHVIMTIALYYYYISLCYNHLAMSASLPAPPALAQYQVNNVPPAAY